MRILRFLTGASVVGLSTLTIGFVAADRLSHLAPPRVVARPAPEPSATGSIALLPPPPPIVAEKKAQPKIPNGFDTERLHALMRSDPILPPSKR